nr:thioredoxin domain-containing protein [Bacillus atrophaeus]
MSKNKKGSPWREEAFEKAKRENKPVLVSIGYSTCHWWLKISCLYQVPITKNSENCMSVVFYIHTLNN